ncbi:MAG: HNH endonuclease [Burkholderiaceae bacterium]|nr:HNH endonuclease [Burkholderiaceae bacterium]
MVSVQRLRELFDYDDEAGVLYWKVSYGKAFKGNRAGYVNASGYMTVGLIGEKFRVHRIVWAVVHGAWPKHVIDHIDGNKLNNRIENLRSVSASVNMQNIRKPTKANTSGYLGVYWSQRRGGWMASLSTAGKQTRWGPYKTAERASEKYLTKKREMHEGCTL